MIVADAAEVASQIAILETLIEHLTLRGALCCAAGLQLIDDLTVLALIGEDAIEETICVTRALSRAATEGGVLVVRHGVKEVGDTHLIVASLSPDEQVRVGAFASLTGAGDAVLTF